MKYNILLLTLFSTTLAMAQITQYKNFRIEDSELIWQHVYDSSLSLTDAEKILKSQSYVRNVVIQDSSIVAELVSMPIEYSRYGYERGFTSMFVLAYDISGRIQIDFKPDRYRVTLFELYLDKKVNAAMFQSGKFSEHVLKTNKKSIRPSFAQGDCIGLHDQNFFDKFKLRILRINSRDW